MLPAEEYGERRGAREAQVARLEEIHIRLGNLRLFLAASVVILGWLSLRSHLLSLWWLLAPVAAFAGIAFWHSRVLRSRELGQRAVAFYDRGLARIEDRWAGTGETGERFSDPHHVYAADLDLFGDASLFQLLSAARTRMGEDTLAQWLLSPAKVDEIRGRHAAARELRNELDLREDLAVMGQDVRVGVHPEALTAWAESPNQMNSRWMVWAAPVLAAGAVMGAISWAAWDVATPLVVVVVVEAALTYGLRKKLDAVLHGTEHAFRDLDLLSGVLGRIEAHSFRDPGLQELQSGLLSSGVTAFQALKRLRTLVDLVNSRHNFFVRLIDAPMMYSVQVVFAAERWRRAHGSAVRSWIAAVGEMEALLSLAAYDFEHPSDTFPEFIDGEAAFEGQELGHPLLPPALCVRNDLAIGGETRVLLVSGSNMSGKSTLLRAVGINTVLAMAGAPVRARRLRLTALRVGANIRINDSLQEGSSRFYAEITRLRQILDFAQRDPSLLFLLDELLQGTNSKDRRIGGEGIVRALVDRGAIGLVSTHDLALTDIGGALHGHLRNVHFEDELANGKMTFDYKLRDGVVTKSNGLELMRSIGLDV
ncbi:MAG TPA: mismatch repair protein [Candidatus Sulfotelmatobacter sp.]|nr:mismatch repair protein [Candidatus Sulfotelmatobacter sp.]